ncbi:RNA 2',3'-cyclic phosphodiesterase [Candidatus Pacearchaeota archaeon]|nr:RNA 2',3'-cyclic phosphodiesterase [Candidatus Pacearchaeota archaeon]
MRCFIAIDLPSEVKQELSKVQSKLNQSSGNKLKLVESENLHLTLVFLDELSDYEVNQIKEKLKNLNFKKFEAKLGSIGVFPSESFIRIVWVAMEPSPIVKELHDKIFESIKSLGKFDSRFESHITLARVKFIADKENFIKKLKQVKVEPLGFEVNSFSIKKSILTEQGPVYENIFKFELK